MHDLDGFASLRVGQFVKIAGKYRDREGFLAVEITCEPSLEDAKIEGLIQHVDLDRKRLSIFGQELPIDEEIEIKDVENNRVSLSALQSGKMVKLKGVYAESKLFAPVKILMKPTLEFNIEELQGAINKIDLENKTLEVNGIRTVVNAKTNIEGLAGFKGHN